MTPKSETGVRKCLAREKFSLLNVVSTSIPIPISIPKVHLGPG